MWIVVCAFVAAIVAGTTSVSAKNPSPAVVVHVQPNLNVLRNVHISFHPTDRLPPGGYYYAVIALEPYRRYTRSEPPPCAISSDMDRTDYGYSYNHQKVVLTLGPTESHTGHWCPGGTYTGGIYAVPHPPLCEKHRYSCRGEPAKEREPAGQPQGPCGGHVCGVVPIPYRYAYPDGLPPPAYEARMIGRFQIVFPLAG
jgi:hypothetical protein